MDQSMVENCASATVEDAEACAPPHPLPPPPLTAQRRPRVREVSSRFMSPAASTGDLPHPLPAKSPLPKYQHTILTPSSTLTEIQSRQRSSSVNRRRRHLDLEPLRCSDENRPTGPSSIHTQNQIWETPLPPDQMLNYRKQRPAKPLKENGGGGGRTQQQQQRQHLPKTTPSRPGTPVATANLDRMSRFRLIQQRSTNLIQQRSTNVTATAAAKLLQCNGMSLPTEATCPDVSNHSQTPSSTARCLPDLLPTVSSRQLVEKSSSRGNATGDFSKYSASPCSRSLNLSLSSSNRSFFLTDKGSEKLAWAISKPYTNGGKTGGLCLPPVPPCASVKPGPDMRKGKKISSHLEDVHSLRVLHNRYLQWRCANARAEASMRAQQRETLRTLYSLAVKIAELYDSMKRKRIELGILQRTKTMSTILEAQIPYLDQWFSLQGDYSIYLAEATQALLNASVQLPSSGSVMANLPELEETLSSAIEVMDTIVFHVQRSMPKAEETEDLVSELARVIGGERALIEECGNLMSNTYTTQVEEWSLRSQIIQSKRCRS